MAQEKGKNLERRINKNFKPPKIGFLGKKIRKVPWKKKGGF